MMRWQIVLTVATSAALLLYLSFQAGYGVGYDSGQDAFVRDLCQSLGYGPVTDAFSGESCGRQIAQAVRLQRDVNQVIDLFR